MYHFTLHLIRGLSLIWGWKTANVDYSLYVYKKKKKEKNLYKF